MLAVLGVFFGVQGRLPEEPFKEVIGEVGNFEAGKKTPGKELLQRSEGQRGAQHTLAHALQEFVSRRCWQIGLPR